MNERFVSLARVQRALRFRLRPAPEASLESSRTKQHVEWRLPPRHSIATVPLACLLVLSASWRAAATTCSDICPGSGSCTINSLKNIDPGSDLDCGNRDLTVTGDGSLKVTGGSFILRARDLNVVGPGGTIYAVEGTDQHCGGIEVDLTGSLTLAGKMRANGNHGGGSLTITAAGDISIPESGTDGVECDGLNVGASGGSIDIQAGGAITMNDPVHAEGNNSGDNAGGRIEIRATGNITAALDGHISATGKTAGGGSVLIVSEAGNITLDEHIDVDGKGTIGDGGDIELSAEGSIQVLQQIYARGGVNTGGGTANGGTVEIGAGCGGVSVEAPIFTTGGQLGSSHGGGSLTVTATGPVSIAAGVLLDTHALADGGNGGDITLRSKDVITLNNGTTLDSRGSSLSQGTGGSVMVAGCRADLKSGATIDAGAVQAAAIFIGASGQPPATGTQPLSVGATAVLRAAGTTSGGNGRIELAPLTYKQGQCSNDGTLSCMLDADCTVGCQTGDCLYANPDTGGQDIQFNITPSRFGDSALPACGTACGQ